MVDRKHRLNPIVEELRQAGGSATTPIPAIYSPFANLTVALFGGVYGIVIFTALSLRRLGRFSAETPFLILILYLWTGLLFWSAGATPYDSGASSSASETAKTVHLIGRVLAVVYFGFFLYRHRIRYETMKFLREKPPNGFWPGMFSIVAGTLIGMAVAGLATMIKMSP